MGLIKVGKTDFCLDTRKTDAAKYNELHFL